MELEDRTLAGDVPTCSKSFAALEVSTFFFFRNPTTPHPAPGPTEDGIDLLGCVTGGDVPTLYHGCRERVLAGISDVRRHAAMDINGFMRC